ncbi:MAG: TolC family protein [Desulfofustis sp.]|nr:TolC family protein [Desulfofustis sp.]
MLPLILVGGIPNLGKAAEALKPPEVWTSREAVIFGLKNSPNSRIAFQRIAAAQAAQAEADALLKHPRLDLSGFYGQTNNPLLSFGNILNQGAFSDDIDFNSPGQTDNLNLKAELSYRFYNGGRDQALVDSAESGYLASQAGLKEVQHQLGYEILKAFYYIVQAQDQHEARRAELAAIASSLEVAKARFEAGDLLKTEVLNFEVQKARTSENLIIAEHQKDLAEKSFLNLLGLEKGNVVISSEDESLLNAPEVNNRRERPELARLSAALQGAEAELRRTRGNNLPTLDGFASYQYDYGWINDGSGDSWAAGVKVNYNLWDGRRDNAEMVRKEAEYQALVEELQKLKLAINLDIEEAVLNYQQAVKRRSVTDKMVEVAQESAQLSRERFKEGVILSSDVLDTEVRLTDTLVRHSAARANHRIATANLRRALGHQQYMTTTEELLEN